MKRKIFSKLLMGALLIASVSSFVSCKDYDDDIDNLQKQIDAAALKTSLDALQQKVDQNATTAAAAAAQALKAAQDAATAASNGDASLQTAINEAKAAAEAAAKTNADNIKDATDAIAKLNAAIEQAKAAAEEAAKQAQDAANNAQSAADKAQATADAAATKAALDEAVKALNEAVAKAQAAAEEAAKKAQETANKAQSAAEKAQATADAAATKEYADKIKEAVEAAQRAAEDAMTAAKAAKYDDTALVAQLTAAKEAATKAATDLAAAEKALGDRIAAIEANYATKTYVADAIAAAINNVQSGQSASQVEAAIQSALASYGQNLASNAVGTYVSSQVSSLKADLAQAMGVEDFSKVQGAFDALSAATDAWYTAITSVSLFANVHEGGDNSATNNFDHMLDFLYTIEKENVFAKDVKFAGANTAAQKVADKQYTFTEGYYRTFADSIMIRVSPANAKFTKDDLILVNSRGEDIVKSGLIEEVTVEPYTRLYALTRAANPEQTGLYVVKFKLKDQFNENDAAQFKAAAQLRENGRDLKVAYAIGIKNTTTPEDAEDRYVVSEYDLTMRTALAGHAWRFNVNNVNVANIHNRWRNDDNGDATTQIPDLEWLDNNEPSTTVVLTGAKANAGDRATGIDNRQWEQILSVVKGEPITIEFTNPIKGFYVTLDNAFATESKPSELNAWVSYTYEGGVGYWKINGNDTTVVAATMHDGNVGTIAVKDMGNVVGDIIGFRVYAVNLDGTLVDPDGRAFYVKIANPVDDTQKINNGKAIAIKATKQFGDASSVSVADVKFDNTVTDWFIEWGDENPDVYNGNFRSPLAGSAQYVINTTSGTRTNMYPGRLFTLTFTDTEGNSYTDNGTIWSSVYQANTVYYQDLATAIRNGKKISSLKVAIDANSYYNGALSLLDNETYNLVLRGVRRSGNVSEEIQTIALSVKKTLPTAIPDVKVKAGQVANLTFNMKPYLHDLYGGYTIWQAWDTYGSARTRYYKDGVANFLAGYTYNTTITPSNAWDVRFAPVSLYGIGYEVKNFADIYSLINPETGANVLDQDYYFEFVDGGLQNEDPSKVIPAVSRYYQNGTYNVANFTDHTYGNRTNASAVAYCLPKIQKSSISVAGVKKDVQIGYTYRNVSLKKNENGAAVMNNVEVAAANKFEYTYKSAFDLNKIKDNGATPTVQTLTYAVSGQNVNAAHITYKEAATAPDAWFELPADGDDLATLVANHYIEVVPESATFTGLTDYFVMSNFNYTTLTATFNAIVDTQDHNITADVTGKVSFKIKDVWGNVKTIDVPLKMPKP